MRRENFSYQKGDLTMIALAEQGLYSQNLYNSACMPVVRFKGHYFTDIEVAVLSLIGEGCSNVEISERLELSKRTVEAHIRSIRHALICKSQTQLNERQLVLFARDMLDGYQVFIKLIHEKRDESKFPLRGKLIEDWDSEEFSELDEVLENELDGLYREAHPQNIPLNNPTIPLKPEFEISDFEAEQREIIYSDGKYYLV